MKNKSFRATAVLACASLALLAVASAYFIGNQTVGAYHQKTLEGDPIYAKDVAVQADIHANQDLYWTLQTQLDGTADSQRDAYALTDNSFGLGEDFRNQEQGINEGLYLWNDLTDLDLPLDVRPDSQLGGKYSLYDYARDQVEVGETKTVTIPLTDFFEEIPFGQMMGASVEFLDQVGGVDLGNVQETGIYNIDDLFSQAIADTFYYPMPEDAVFSTTITRDSETSSSGTYNNDTVHYQPWLDSIMTEYGCYFTLYVQREEQEQPITILDPSGVEIGFGLYRVIWENGAPKFTCVTPVDWQTAQHIQVETSADDKQVYLLVQTPQGEQITVVDTQSGEIIQQMLMPQYPAIWEIIPLDNAVLFCLAAENEGDTYDFALFDRLANGTLVYAFDGYDTVLDVPTMVRDWDDTAEVFYYREGVNSVYLLQNNAGRHIYDGERLVIVQAIDRYESADYMVAVYDKNGRQYVGQYICDMDNLRRQSMQYSKALTVRFAQAN